MGTFDGKVVPITRGARPWRVDFLLVNAGIAVAAGMNANNAG